MSGIEKKCAEVFSAVMDVPIETVNSESSPDNVEGWDSLAHVELISSLEEAFSLEIPPEDGIEIETFGMIVQFIRNKLS